MAANNSKNNKEFEIFEHTADIGIKAYGDTIDQVFENAARGMFNIIFHNSIPKIKPKGAYQIKLHASDLEQLLVDWLDEVLYIFTTEQIVISDYKISIEDKTFTLDAEVSGEILPEEKIMGTCEIKAVTYHMLSIKKISCWEAQVLFDI